MNYLSTYLVKFALVTLMMMLKSYLRFIHESDENYPKDALHM